jgi:hypothetical protein
MDIDVLLKSILLKKNTESHVKQLYSHYFEQDHIYSSDLVEGLIDMLKKYHLESKQNKFYNDIYQITTYYTPVPLTPVEFERNGYLINYHTPNHSSVHGEIFFNVANGIEIAVKTPLVNKEEFVSDPDTCLRETFLNFVILNKYIERGNLHLVPTYGFFLCDKSETSVCACSEHKNPYIHFIQKRVYGRTLMTIINDSSSALTVEKCKSILSQVFDTLIKLQESPYEIAHNDLNLNNIMVSDESEHSGHAYLIDWGLVSFTYNGIRHKGFGEKKYCTNEPLKSGAHDIYFLLVDIIRGEYCSPELNQWGVTMLKRLFYNKLLKGDLSFHELKESGHLFTYLSKQEQGSYQEQAHQHNMTYLNTLTYRRISEQIELSILPVKEVVLPVSEQKCCIQITQNNFFNRSTNNCNCYCK